MEYKVNNLTDENQKYIKIDLTKNCINELNSLKNSIAEKSENQINIANDEIRFCIDFNDLNLGTKLYGNSKEASSILQSQNCKIVLKIYKVIKKSFSLAMKLSKKFNLKVSETIYIKNLDKKRNNNDFLISSMLDIDFNKGNRYEKIISHAADFLALENNIHNMCDFRDNKCLSCRERNIDRVIGCCQKNCKFTHTGTCTVKNIACKLYMCDYIENKGYYFSPYFHPILKRYFNIIQRFACTAVLFRSLETQVKIIKWTKYLTYSAFLIIIAVIILGLTI